MIGLKRKYQTDDTRYMGNGFITYDDRGAPSLDVAVWSRYVHENGRHRALRALNFQVAEALIDGHLKDGGYAKMAEVREWLETHDEGKAE